MMNSSCLDVICDSALVENLNDSEIKILSDLMERIELQDNEILASEGDDNGCLYVLESGILVVVKCIEEGEQEILHRHKAKEVVGISGFVEGQKRLAGLVASGPTRVVALNREAFEQIIEVHPMLVYKVMMNIARESQNIINRLDGNMVDLCLI